MRQRIVSIGVLVAVVAVLGAVPAAAAGRDSADRPWKERTTGDTAVMLADCESTVEGEVTCTSQLEYSVKATHVGRAELTAVGVVTIFADRSCETPDGLTGVPARNDTDEVIVAADGSEIHSLTVYNSCTVFTAPSPFTAVRTITGGTGRFAGASGSVSLTGTQAGAVGEMTGRGSIAY